MESDNEKTERKSKTERKHQMLILQKLGETLVQLSESQLKKIPLPSNLSDAVHTARNLKSREALRRQLQYIGKLMRHVDPAPILESVEKIQFKSQQSKAQFRQIEKWRDKLIAEGDAILPAFFEQYPDTDKQQLRQLVRKAQLDMLKKHGTDTALFRYIRDIIENS